MIKRIIFFLCSIAAFVPVFAQEEDPVQWEFSAKSTGNGMYEIHLTATISKGWHLYAQSGPPNGPTPTRVTFHKNPLVAPEGKVTERGLLRERFEPSFGVEVKYYKDKVDLVQLVKLKGKVKTNITGAVLYMTCNSEKCLPPAEKKFSIQLRE